MKQEYLTPFPTVSGPEKFHVGVKCSRVTNQNSSGLGLLQHIISDTVPIARVGLSIRRRTSSPEDIKSKEGGRNKIFYLHPKHPCNELMVADI